MSLGPPPSTLLTGGSLFLDFDGTLVQLAERPDAVQVEQALLDLLARLQLSLDGRVALLSGRAVADVRSWLHPLRFPVGGSHGFERAHADSELEAGERPASFDQAIALFDEVAAAHPGVLVEDKPFGVALHYRLAPSAEPVCRDAAEHAAQATGLELQPGKMVFELKPGGSSKGLALEQFMEEQPFAGMRPIFLGDDLTDENAFAAARRLGGAGVLVGPERPTTAGYRLPDVSAVHQWLRDACEALV